MLKSILLILLTFCFGPNLTNNIVKKPIEKNSISIDLLMLKANGTLNELQEIIVEDDPVYHKRKRYLATPFLPILKAQEGFAEINVTNTKIVFECEDGYKPEMPLEKFLTKPSFIAQKDLDAPKGSDWEQIMKDGHQMKTEPFYIIYEGVNSTEHDFKWPYNLIKIHLEPLHQNDNELVPKNENFMAGYKIFVNQCQVCHAINNIGGNMGPELNYPQSVTSYWKRASLVEFIMNPASFRANVKMPKPSINKTQTEQIVAYLEYMAIKK